MSTVIIATIISLVLSMVPFIIIGVVVYTVISRARNNPQNNRTSFHSTSANTGTYTPPWERNATNTQQPGQNGQYTTNGTQQQPTSPRPQFTTYSPPTYAANVPPVTPAPSYSYNTTATAAPTTPAPQTTAVPNNSAPQKVNVNSCTVQELLTLPGIDQFMAENIIAVRNRMSFFLSFDDFVNATGIQPHVAVEIEPLVSISPAGTGYATSGSRSLDI